MYVDLENHAKNETLNLKGRLEILVKMLIKIALAPLQAFIICIAFMLSPVFPFCRRMSEKMRHSKFGITFANERFAYQIELFGFLGLFCFTLFGINEYPFHIFVVGVCFVYAIIKEPKKKYSL